MRGEIGAARAEHGQHVDAAGDAQIAAHPALGGRQHERLSGFDGQAPPRIDGLAVERRAELGAGDRDARRAREAERGGTDRDFDGGRVRPVADEPVADFEREPVECAAERDAKMARAAPAEILHARQRAGAQHFDVARCVVLAHRASTPAMTKRTRSPGSKSVGGCRDGSNSASDVRPISCQPPGDVAG